MQLVFHTGVHFTEQERLLKCLLRNKEVLHARGVTVPGPGKYRKLMRDSLVAMKTGALAENAREVLLDAMLDDEKPDRVLMSHKHLFGVPRAALRKGLLYPNAPERMEQVATIFNCDEIEHFVALRNPATFLPAAFKESPRETLDHFTDGVDPREIKWSDTISKLRQAAPEIPITVWCNEDAPLVWGQVVRELAGLEHGDEVIGRFDLAANIMRPEGMDRFEAYVKGHPDMSEIQIRRVLAAFLEKFALEAEIEEELDMPGWTSELVEEMTQIYDDDVFEVSRIPGVTLIAP